MARPRLEAHLVVLATTVTKYPTVTNLLGIDYYHVVPADTEFPKRMDMLDVFVRFFHWGCRPETIAIEVWSLTDTAEDRTLLHRTTKEVDFRPTEPVHDCSFRLRDVQVPDVGLYAARVCRLTRSRLRGVYWKKLREDYFRIRRDE
jgi:hypothetical protein